MVCDWAVASEQSQPKLNRVRVFRQPELPKLTNGFRGKSLEEIPRKLKVLPRRRTIWLMKPAGIAAYSSGKVAKPD